MPLIGSESQGGGDTCDVYADDENLDDQLRKWYAAMRELIPKLSERLPDTKAWGLTSHSSLCLMSVPEYDAGDNYVIIEHYYDGCFRMSCHPPEGELPIPDSHITFVVMGVAEALDRILLGMTASRGWPNSKDLPSY